MALDEDLGAGIGKSRGLASQQFVLGEEKRGQPLIALSTLMFVARPRERCAQVIIAGAADHETESGCT